MAVNMKHIMLDIEMNKVLKKVKENGDHLSNELIEIGAVMMNEKFEKVDTFQTYVYGIYGNVAPIITRLTGITDENLKGAPEFDEAMTKFLEWAGDGDITWYSWSLSDLRQFQSESLFKKSHIQEVEKMAENWIDFQKVYCEMIGVSKMIKLEQAVSAVDYTFKGEKHSGLDDAINTAEILILSKDKKKFDKVMKPIKDLFTPKTTGNTLLSMCPEFFEQFDKKNKDE